MQDQNSGHDGREGRPSRSARILHNRHHPDDRVGRRSPKLKKEFCNRLGRATVVKNGVDVGFTTGSPGESARRAERVGTGFSKRGSPPTFLSPDGAGSSPRCRGFSPRVKGNLARCLPNTLSATPTTSPRSQKVFLKSERPNDLRLHGGRRSSSSPNPNAPRRRGAILIGTEARNVPTQLPSISAS